MDVVSVAPSLEAAETAGLFDRERVDVVLLDIRLGTDSGLRALRQPGPGASGPGGTAGAGEAGEPPADRAA